MSIIEKMGEVESKVRAEKCASVILAVELVDETADPFVTFTSLCCFTDRNTVGGRCTWAMEDTRTHTLHSQM